MKNYLFAFIILLFTNQILSQKYTEQDIIGKWKVVKILNENKNPNLSDFIKSFSSAKFEFKENLDFKITTSDQTKSFTMLINMTKDAKWKLNGNNYAISVGNDLNKYSILKIIVFAIDDRTIFHMDETELDIEVQKE